ncbi:hypothetical protein H7I53_08980 [Mycolicibacterium pulveris]|uniref:Chitin-binding type-2 domain-containing protein n=1 Tax=Mycolicibacterium pulveris TaxID=36813 RepID=A0A7I7UK44_MYCPV|nr:hypothetical protein [Mycolicibacterium pulveris]MCV6980355.1 hypothetical protein [Mycolicibacterium pulveris]BBY81745.1 hypothetical protein MPUL_29030 [Mycolicibacterium pulveris]
MTTYLTRIPSGRKHMSATVFGAAAIALAIGGLAQPAISQAAWDIEVYDECLKLNGVKRGCCVGSGGEWDESAGKCVAPLTAQTPPQSPGELHQIPGTGIFEQTQSTPQSPGQAPDPATQPPAQPPVLHPWLR